MVSQSLNKIESFRVGFVRGWFVYVYVKYV